MKNEQSTFFSTYEIAYLAMTVAACVVGRMLFQFIPNIQPMTAIFLILTYQLGVSRGLVVNVLSLLITNLYMGMGIWTISQILSFSVVIGCMGLLCRWPTFRKKRSLVIAMIDVQIYGMPQFWPYYLAGLYFDLLHGLGNGMFYLLLAPIFQQLFYHIKKKA
jgi:hypothetical protein